MLLWYGACIQFLLAPIWFKHGTQQSHIPKTQAQPLCSCQGQEGRYTANYCSKLMVERDWEPMNFRLRSNRYINYLYQSFWVCVWYEVFLCEGLVSNSWGSNKPERYLLPPGTTTSQRDQQKCSCRNPWIFRLGSCWKKVPSWSCFPQLEELIDGHETSV